MVDYIGRPRASWWFWTICVLGLLWNIMGVGSFLMDTMASHEYLIETYGQQTADAFRTQPIWVTMVYGSAVFTGAIGSVFLLLRKREAVGLFLISLVCILLQQIYWWFMTDIADIQPAFQKFLMIMIILIGTFLLWFTRSMAAKKIIQ